MDDEPPISRRFFLVCWLKTAVLRDWKPSQVVWAIVSLVLAVAGFVASEVPEWRSTLGDLTWQVPLAAFALLGGARAILAPYWIYRDKMKEVNDLNSTIAEREAEIEEMRQVTASFEVCEDTVFPQLIVRDYPVDRVRFCVRNRGPATARNVRVQVDKALYPPVLDWGGPYPHTLERDDHASNDIHSGDRAFYHVLNIEGEEEDDRVFVRMPWEQHGGMMLRERQPGVAIRCKVTADNLVQPHTIFVAVWRHNGKRSYKFTDESPGMGAILKTMGYPEDLITRLEPHI